MDTEEKYARSIIEEKRKRRWKNTECKHRIQMHNAHRHCTLPIKRRCAIISNMKIMSMKGGRISKYKSTYRERNDPQETPCTLPKINRKSTV